MARLHPPDRPTAGSGRPARKGVIMTYRWFPRIAVLILLIGVLVVPAASAQDPASLVTARLGPANDWLSSSETVTFIENGSTEIDGESNVGATTEFNEILGCSGHPFGATVWYRLQVTRDTRVSVETQSNPPLDTVLSVYDGFASLGSLTRVDCNDDISATNLDSRVEFTARQGWTYSIQVGGYGGEEGGFDLHFDYETVPPGNDDFADAWVGLGHQTQDTAGATTEAGEPRFCGTSELGATVWYYVESASPLAVAVDTRGSDFDTVLAVYTGNTVGSLTQVICNDDISSSDFDSEVEFTAQPDVLYRIQVGGFAGETGSLELYVSWSAAGHFCRGRPANRVGTAGNDVIYGTAGSDVIVGLGGDDLIYGYGGKDFICAGPGRDTVYAGPGNDRILGDAGDDELHGQSGNDRIFGRLGNDVIFGELGDDRLNGNVGWDTLRGDAGFDTCKKGEDVICEMIIG
jgi:serralysin